MDVHLLLAILHIIIIVPCLLYIALQRAATPDWVFSTLFGVGLFVFAYQAYKAYVRWMVRSPSLWVNLFHVFLVAPLLIYIGYQAKKTPRPAYELLAILTFGALGYHLYNLIIISQTFTTVETV